MQDYSKFNKEAQEYFNSLPVFMQEDIMQSGVQVYTKNDLVNLMENTLHEKTDCGCGKDNR